MNPHERDLSESARESLRGRGRGEGLNGRLLESRTEDLDLEGERPVSPAAGKRAGGRGGVPGCLLPLGAATVEAGGVRRVPEAADGVERPGGAVADGGGGGDPVADADAEF